MSVAPNPITQAPRRELRATFGLLSMWICLQVLPARADTLCPSPHTCFESGREVYLPTGETVDLVLPVHATAAPAAAPADLIASESPWLTSGLVALLFALSCAGRPCLGNMG